MTPSANPGTVSGLVGDPQRGVSLELWSFHRGNRVTVIGPVSLPKTHMAQ